MVEQTGVLYWLKNRLVILALCLIALAYIAVCATRNEDLSIFMAAAKDMFTGKDMYTLKYKDGYHFLYSTLFATIIYPLNFLPVYVATFIWLLLNTYLLYRLIRLLSKYFPLAQLTPKQQWVFVALCVVTCIRLVTTNIAAHQTTICILYLTLEGLEQIFSGKKALGALLIALAINFKLLPLLFIPYLIYRAEFKASFLVLGFYAALLELPALVIGFSQNHFYLASWLHLINPNDPVQVLDTDEGGFTSLSSLLSVLLVKQAPLHEDPQNLARNITDIGIDQFRIVVTVMRLLFAAFTLYFLRTMPFVSKVGKAKRFWEISYILLIIPLIFPHQQFYSFLFAVPAIGYLYYYLITNHATLSKGKYYTLICLLALSYLLCNAGPLIGPLYVYTRYFKTVTYGMLLLVPLLAMCKPKEEVS